MDKLAAVDALVVQQQKEWGEILSGFETKNKYVVMDAAGGTLYAAAEVGGSFLGRTFLKAARPFTIKLLGLDGSLVLEVRRPFRFFFHQADVLDAQGGLIGTIKRRWSVVRRIYTVLDGTGREMLQLFGPILHPWTFEIRDRGRTVGKVTKKWSGLLKEGFTDADNFGVTFPADWDVELKALFVGAVFLIDFVHFEDTGRD